MQPQAREDKAVTIEKMKTLCPKDITYNKTPILRCSRAQNAYTPASSKQKQGFQHRADVVIFVWPQNRNPGRLCLVRGICNPGEILGSTISLSFLSSAATLPPMSKLCSLYHFLHFTTEVASLVLFGDS